LENQRRSLLQTDTDFAALSVATDLSRAFPVYAAGLVMPFGRNFFFLLGHQEVVDFYAGATPDEVLSWNPIYAGSSPSGDLGFTVGTSVDTVTNPDGSVDRFYSKYLTLWARQSDGAWRFIADGGAPSPAPTP
jgi:ketosteroid isomerase-like protein